MFKKFSQNKGFTLIELLVVIAIIGLLASVVLASLNTARGKGADGAIKSDLHNAQTQAELLFDNNSPNSYSGICSDTAITAMVTHARNATGISAALVTALATAGTQTTAVCHVSATNDSYAISIPLKTNNANSWCIDSTGAAQQTNGATGGYLAANDVTCN